MQYNSAEVTAYHVYRNDPPEDKTIAILERSKSCCLDRIIFHRKNVTGVELEEHKDFLSGTRLRITVHSENINSVASDSSDGSRSTASNVSAIQSVRFLG